MKATKTLVSKIENIKSLELQLNALKNQIEKLKNEVKERMGEEDELIYKDAIIATYKTELRTTLNSTLLKKEDPELYKKYSKTTSLKRFLIK